MAWIVESFSSYWWPQFDKNATKVYLKAGTIRLQKRTQKMEEKIKQSSRTIIQLLKEEKKNEAFLRVEEIIKDTNYCNAQRNLELYMEILEQRLQLLHEAPMSNIPEDLLEAVHTILFASQYLDCDELHKIRGQVALKFKDPKEFGSVMSDLKWCNPKVRSQLSQVIFSEEEKNYYMTIITGETWKNTTEQYVYAEDTPQLSAHQNITFPNLPAHDPSAPPMFNSGSSGPSSFPQHSNNFPDVPQPDFGNNDTSQPFAPQFQSPDFPAPPSQFDHQQGNHAAFPEVPYQGHEGPIPDFPSVPDSNNNQSFDNYQGFNNNDQGFGNNNNNQGFNNQNSTIPDFPSVPESNNQGFDNNQDLNNNDQGFGHNNNNQGFNNQNSTIPDFPSVPESNNQGFDNNQGFSKAIPDFPMAPESENSMPNYPTSPQNPPVSKTWEMTTPAKGKDFSLPDTMDRELDIDDLAARFELLKKRH